MAGIDFGTSFGAAIARDSVCAAIQEARYCFQFNSLVEALGKEKENLIIKRKSVLDRARKAKEETKRIDIVVEKWMNVTVTLMAEVEKLEKKIIARKSYCFGCCPNWIYRYCLAKQIQKKTKAMLDHCKDGEFKQFDRLLTLPGMKYYSTEGFLYFNCTRVAYDQILEALKDDEVHMIGLHGMGGSGKTTLVKVVGKEAENLFDKVFFLPVSATVEVRKIQGKIANSLGLELKEEDEPERARRLWLSLTNCEERILIILDDVWEKLDLEAIGIPFGENHKGCNILLTTRRKQVCNLMGCEIMTFLSLLEEEEAWTFFKKHAGIIDDTSDALKSLAQEITKKCKGLPVAIAAVASTLKGKTLAVWEEALERLRDSRPMDVEEGLRNPYTCLQLSYDNLREEEAKSLFLLCCLFPEDYEIHMELLTRIGIGLGLFGEVHTYKGARNQVTAAINKLIDSCLLLEADEEKCIKMHDLVRDVGLWIAKKEIQVVIWPQNYRKAFKVEDETIKNSMIRYLWCNIVDRFPDKLEFPKLEFLCVLTDLDHVELPDQILEGMKELKVLVLVNQSYGREKPILQLSKAIQSLTNLHCLLLFGWELGDISFLGSLKRLETLMLRSCSFRELPNGIVHLKDLRLLHLSECQIQRNPYEVIGKCSQLEELYFIENEGAEWTGPNENAAEFFDKNSVDIRGLQRYCLEIGKSFRLFHQRGFSISRGLSVQYFDASTSNATIKVLMQKAEVLYLGEICRGCKNIIPDILQAVGGGMNELTELLLCNSDTIECLLDNTNYICRLGRVFSKLIKLNISAMVCLEALSIGPPPPDIFEKLEELHIEQCSQLRSALSVGKLNLCSLKALELENCPMLRCLFTPAVAQSLVLLEILEIRKCDGLKHIMASEAGEIISDDSDRNSCTTLFPKLKRLVVEGCKLLENFIPVSHSHGLVHLERLQIIDNPELKYVFGQHNHEDRLPYRNQNKFQIKFPDLKVLGLEDLPNLIGICPENYYPTWPSLHESRFLGCPELNIMSINNSIVGSEVTPYGYAITEEVGPLVMHSLQTVQNVKILWIRNCKILGIFQLSGLRIGEELDPLTSSLQDLCLENLPELSYICKGPTQFMRLQSLESLEVHGCSKLKIIFSACIQEGLPQLKLLKVTCCDQLEQLIEDNEHQNLLMEPYEAEGCPKTISSAPFEKFPRACQNLGSFNLCSLERLVVESCPMLISLFAQSTAKTMTSLEDLRIESCHGLKYIIKDVRVLGNEREGTVQDDHNLQNFVSVFPRLNDLRIEKCNLLEYIFPVFLAHGLVGLRNIEICETPCLKYVFGQSCHEDQSSYQHQNKIQIKFPLLEEVKLNGLPNLISICSKNYYATCSSLPQLSLNDIGLSTSSVSNLMVGSELTDWDCNSAEDLWAVVGCVKSFKSLIVEGSNMEGIYNLEGLPIDGKRVTFGLVVLDLHGLPELRYICRGPKNFLSLDNLSSLTVVECRKLKFVFSASVLRILPQLGTLIIVNCEELEQIVEEDEENQNQSNSHAGEVCFPQLTVLLVIHCNKLKRLFSVSTSLEFPNLEQLIINEASQLEEVFGCGQGEAEKRREIMLPKLEHLILVELPSLVNVCQGIELQTLRYRVVHDCPKLTLTRTTTLGDLLQQYQNKDNEMDDHSRMNLLILLQMVEANRLSRIRETGNANSSPETTSHVQMVQNDSDSEVQEASESELPSSQSIKEREKDIIEEGLVMATSTDSKSFKEAVQEVPTSDKASILTSPTHSGPGIALRSLISLSPQELTKDDSVTKPISMEQQALGKDKIAHKTPCKPSNPIQNVEEPKSHSFYEEPSKKNSMAISLGVPESSIAPVASLESTSDLQIPLYNDSTSRNLLAELSNRTRFYKLTSRIENLDPTMILWPEVFEKLKTELTVYLDMPLEAICEANALDNVERIANSLARGATDFVEKKILKDFISRLEVFKECVPKAVSSMKSSSEFISNYENLNAELSTKLNEGQERVRELESKLSEMCAEEYELETESQRLITRKIEILMQKKSLAFQLDQSTQAVTKDYEKSKIVEEELKQSTEKWLKSREVLAHANASWKIFKESLGL